MPFKRMSEGELVPPRRLPSAVTVGLGLVFVLAAAMFVPTAVGFVSYDQVQTADVTVEEVRFADDGSTLELTIAFTNPTFSEVEVISAEMYARVDGDIVNHIAGVRADAGSISGGETRRFEVRMPLRAGQTDRVEAAFESGRLLISGELWVEVSNERRPVTVEESYHD